MRGLSLMALTPVDPTCLRLLDALAQQAAWCETPAPFTARLLRRSQQWLAADRQALRAFAAVAADPLAAAVPLRWAGALHHLALRGDVPWADLWPPRGLGLAASDAAIDAALRAAWQTRRPLVDDALALPPQTNEVQRSAALLPGLLHVAAGTGLPLVLLEIGASAGLNLWCDHYRHDHGAWAWGPAGAPLLLRSDWRGPLPAAAAAGLQISRRAGCDAHPVDLRQSAEGLRLESFIWPDQPERLARLHTARQAVAGWMQASGVVIESLPAADFVARELAAPAAGHVMVLMHSVVWQYVAADEQAAIQATVRAAAQRAHAGAPLAWLRLEPSAIDGGVELRCRLWSGAGAGGNDGEDVLLARAHPHAAHIEWLGPAA
jgi:hypothetical protein